MRERERVCVSVWDEDLRWDLPLPLSITSAATSSSHMIGTSRIKFKTKVLVYVLLPTLLSLRHWMARAFSQLFIFSSFFSLAHTSLSLSLSRSFARLAKRISNVPPSCVLTDDYHIRTRQGRHKSEQETERARERMEREIMVIVLIEWMQCDQRKYEEEQEDES